LSEKIKEEKEEQQEQCVFATTRVFLITFKPTNFAQLSPTPTTNCDGFYYRGVFQSLCQQNIFYGCSDPLSHSQGILKPDFIFLGKFAFDCFLHQI